MKTNYSLSFLLENTGCYKSSQIKDLFPKGREEVNYLDIIGSGIPLEEKFWFFCKRVFSEKQNRQIAIELAECVLPLYEEKYPDNKSPREAREAIEAAKLYLVGLITIGELEIKREAVKAAGAIVYAAYAAVDAACAASRAAAAYDTAYASYAAAFYASYAAGNTKYKQKLIKILINFIEKNKN